MQFAMDPAIEAVLAGVIIGFAMYVALLVCSGFIAEAQNQGHLTIDQQADLEKTASDTIDWIVLLTSSPGKEIIAILTAVGVAVGYSQRAK